MKKTLTVNSSERVELIDITNLVAGAIASLDVCNGICMVYVPHTTAAVTINESYDPDVCRDLTSSLNALIPRDGGYHHAEGNSDAHIKASLIGASEMVPIEGGSPSLGRWQGIFFCEFDGPRKRKVEVYLY